MRPVSRVAMGAALILSAASMLAHNLGRELQMSAEPRTGRDTTTRAARWPFRTLHTLRHVVLRAGRITRPEGKLTLTMSGNRTVASEVTPFSSMTDT